MLLGREDLAFSYANIEGADVATVKPRAGVLHAIVLNTPVASATVALHDGADTNAPRIGVIELPATLLEGARTIPFDIDFADGLTVETTGDGIDVTIIYR